MVGQPEDRDDGDGPGEAKKYICKPSGNAGYSLPNQTRLITFTISIRHNPFNKRNLCQIQTESHQTVDPSAMTFGFADNVLGNPWRLLLSVLSFLQFQTDLGT